MHEQEEKWELSIVQDESAFRSFLAKDPTGFEVFAEQYGQDQIVAVKSDAGDFVKWLKINRPEINATLESKAPRLLLCSSDIWLPLAFLASDIAFPVYLNLVSNYLYDRMKGALKSESTRVHFCVEYEDITSGKIKRFSFDGDAESLQKVIKRFDVNKFIDE